LNAPDDPNALPAEFFARDAGTSPDAGTGPDGGTLR